MKKAFSMIELIFVIVILGILASIAIPRLSTTRDDAELAKAAEEIRTLITDLGAYYTGHGHFDSVSKMTNISLTDNSFNNFDANLTTKAYYSNSSKTDKCIGIQVGVANGDINVSTESAISGFCSGLNRVLKDSIKVHHFGGSQISYN